MNEELFKFELLNPNSPEDRLLVLTFLQELAEFEELDELMRIWNEWLAREFV